MKTLKLAILSSALLFAAACTIGEEALTPDTENGEVMYLDTDGDGEFDAIDVDGDGEADYFFNEEDGELDPVSFCSNPFVDLNGDGVIDGIDYDCDGVIDIRLNLGGGNGGGSGGGSVNQCRTQINGQEISCRSENGGAYNCECKINGAVVSTCSTRNSGACSQPGNGNCCGF